MAIVHLDGSGQISLADDLARSYGLLPGMAVDSLLVPSSAAAFHELLVQEFWYADEVVFHGLHGRVWAVGAVRSRRIDGWRVTLIEITSRALLQSAGQHQDRIAAVRSWSTSVAREFNEPLAIVAGRLELVLALGGLPPELERHLEIAVEHAARIQRSVRSLRDLGRSPRDSPLCQLAVVMEEVGQLLGPHRERVGLPANQVEVRCHPQALARGLVGLLRPVLDELPGERVLLACTVDGGEVVLSMPSAKLQSLGWFGRGVIAASGADLRVDAHRMVLRLWTGCHTWEVPDSFGPVLVVGGAEVQFEVCSVLGRHGVTALQADSVPSALRVLRNIEPEAVVSQLHHPRGASGIALFQAIADRYPRLANRGVLLSAAPGEPHPVPVTVLAMPVHEDALMSALLAARD